MRTVIDKQHEYAFSCLNERRRGSTKKEKKKNMFWLASRKNIFEMGFYPVSPSLRTRHVVQINFSDTFFLCVSYCPSKMLSMEWKTKEAMLL